MPSSITKIPRHKITWNYGSFPDTEVFWTSYENQFSFLPKVAIEVTPFEYAPWTPLGNPFIWDWFASTSFWGNRVASPWQIPVVSPYAWYMAFPYLWPANWLGYR